MTFFGDLRRKVERMRFIESKASNNRIMYNYKLTNHSDSLNIYMLTYDHQNVLYDKVRQIVPTIIDLFFNTFPNSNTSTACPSLI